MENTPLIQNVVRMMQRRDKHGRAPRADVMGELRAQLRDASAALASQTRLNARLRRRKFGTEEELELRGREVELCLDELNRCRVGAKVVLSRDEGAANVAAAAHNPSGRVAAVAACHRKIALLERRVKARRGKVEELGGLLKLASVEEAQATAEAYRLEAEKARARLRHLLAPSDAAYAAGPEKSRRGAEREDGGRREERARFEEEEDLEEEDLDEEGGGGAGWTGHRRLRGARPRVDEREREETRPRSPRSPGRSDAARRVDGAYSRREGAHATSGERTHTHRLAEKARARAQAERRSVREAESWTALERQRVSEMRRLRGECERQKREQREREKRGAKQRRLEQEFAALCGLSPATPEPPSPRPDEPAPEPRSPDRESDADEETATTDVLFELVLSDAKAAPSDVGGAGRRPYKVAAFRKTRVASKVSRVSFVFSRDVGQSDGAVF